MRMTTQCRSLAQSPKVTLILSTREGGPRRGKEKKLRLRLDQVRVLQAEAEGRKKRKLQALIVRGHSTFICALNWSCSGSSRSSRRSTAGPPPPPPPVSMPPHPQQMIPTPVMGMHGQIGHHPPLGLNGQHGHMGHAMHGPYGHHQPILPAPPKVTKVTRHYDYLWVEFLLLLIHTCHCLCTWVFCTVVSLSGVALSSDYSHPPTTSRITQYLSGDSAKSGDNGTV